MEPHIPTCRGHQYSHSGQPRTQNLGLFFRRLNQQHSSAKRRVSHVPLQTGEIRDHSSCKTWILARILSNMICTICRAIDQLSNAGVALLPA